jgi:hypothetical protein
LAEDLSHPGAEKLARRWGWAGKISSTTANIGPLQTPCGDKYSITVGKTELELAQRL